MRDSIPLLRMSHGLKLNCCLFLGFSIEYFWTLVDGGNGNHVEQNHRYAGANMLIFLLPLVCCWPIREAVWFPLNNLLKMIYMTLITRH